MTQEGLGRAVGLDRTAITRLESGERKLAVPELVAIANALGRPLAYFVTTPVAAVVSRRTDTAHAHATTRVLGAELEQFAADLRTLLDMGLVPPFERPAHARVPRSHAAAETLAGWVRRLLSIGDEPIHDLPEACELLGLYNFSASLGEGGPDGGCVEISDARESLGAAVINGETPSGRRRMTLAHELGHWLCGDAYDSEASLESERMINSFAIHFLAPRTGIAKVWNRDANISTRDRALTVGATFRLSWSAAIGQLRNVNLIDYDEYRSLSSAEPSAGDYLRLGLRWKDEPASPYLPSGFTAACLNGYVSGRLTPARTLELLRGTLTVDDLPSRETRTLETLKRSFVGHSG